MTKKIVLTGGGTAGHVTPNLALVGGLKERGYEISYIGSYEGIEKSLVQAQGIPYYGISSGKLRRYFDLQNFTDPARVVKGLVEARSLLHTIAPDIVFSKGGYVSVPVVLAAHGLKIPVIIHESDMTPGLANKLSFSSASAVCCNFPETIPYLPKGKAVLTGSPIRRELLKGERKRGLDFCGFNTDKPVLLIIGGSLGSVAVNTAVRSVLPGLLENFQVLHLCGKGNLDPELEGTKGYAQYEYISEELPDLFAASDLVISRAGANAICELLELRKPSILIPLPASASRGDQLLNAKSFAKQGYSIVLEEETITPEVLLETVRRMWKDREIYIRNMAAGEASDAVQKILDLIDRYAQKQA